MYAVRAIRPARGSVLIATISTLPKSSPALARKRSQVVLDRMVSAKKLTKIQAMELQDEITALPVLARN